MIVKSFFDKAVFKLINLKRSFRKLFIIVSDLLLVIFSLLIAIYLIYDFSLILIKNDFIALLIFIPFISFFVYNFTGQYIGLTKYISNNYFYQIIYRNIFIIFSIYLIGLLTSNNLPTFKFLITFFVVNSTLTVLLRIFFKEILLRVNLPHKKVKNVVIYGAGEAGAQLSYSLKFNRNFYIQAFFDDDVSLQGRILNDILIRSPKDIPLMVNKIDQVLLAMPSINNAKRLKIVTNLKKYKISVMDIPSIDDLSNGRASIDRLRPIMIEDLLGRESSEPITVKCKEMIKNKIVAITGGAGSIGSEICRQILYLSPKKIIIIENNEHSLYKLEKEIESFNFDDIEIEYSLSNAADQLNLLDIFENITVDYVFHAAAYKHVNLVEKNPLPAIFNNIFSTLAVCQASFKTKVKNIILISSDKAVRPTNLMGVTKRISELIFQAYNEKSKLDYSKNKKNFSCFSIVRFGNVLGSSGSVVPLFLEQIAKGGPITLTDPKVIRYFMTIPEASQLVVESISLAKGGEIFLLEMGSPVLIKDLAIQVINLSGLEVKNNKNPNGDIEIKNTGLKPGEKLYEELYLDNLPEKTSHSLISKTTESFIKYDSLKVIIGELKKTIFERNLSKIVKILSDLVPEWEKSSFIKELAKLNEK